MEVLFYLIFPGFRKSIACEIFTVLDGLSSAKGNVLMNIGMGRW
jgi:hypothetical protein